MTVIKLKFPVVLVLGAGLEKYEGENSLFEVRLNKASLHELENEGWLILDSMGNSVFFKEFIVSKPSSWFGKLLRFKRITPISPISRFFL